MSTSESINITRIELLYYSMLALPLAFVGLPIYVHAPDFYVNNFNLSLTSIGVVLILLRLLDAVQDPLIGSLSDQFYKKRKTILLLGLSLMGSGYWMLFHPVQAFLLPWFIASILVCTTGFSIVSINFQTLGALWKTNECGRTRITSWREAFGLFGLLAAAVTPVFLGATLDPGAAFHRLALLYIPLLLATGFLFFRWMDRVSIDPLSDMNELSGSHLQAWFSIPWKRHFFGIYLYNTTAAAIPSVLVLFFIRDRLGAEAYAGLFLSLYFTSGALSMLLWQRIAKIFGKYYSWGFGMVLAVATFIWTSLLGWGDGHLYGLICILSGFALGADLTLPPSILADHISDNKDQYRASRYFSILTLFSKVSLALATAFTLPFLGMAGYQPGNVSDYSVTNSLSIAYSLIPCGIKITALLWLWRAKCYLI